MRAILLTLAYTGMRVSELAGLRWTELDLNQGTICLKNESQRKHKPTQDRRTLKSGKSRSFPLHSEVRQVLVTIEQHSDGRVFHGPLGGKVKPDKLRRALIRDVLQPLADKFPVSVGNSDFADGRLHSFRHYFCSACVNANIPERVLMDWLGHSSSRMVRHYYHLHDAESQRHMRKLEDNGRNWGPVPAPAQTADQGDRQNSLSPTGGATSQ